MNRFLRFVRCLPVAGVALTWSGCVALNAMWWRARQDRVLMATHATEHLTMRFEPGGSAAGAAVNLGRDAERELARITAALELANDRHYTVFLFEDPRRFHELTKAPDYVAGFADGGALCVVFDDRQALIHELVHLVAYAAIADAPSPLLSEGLANALLESSHGVPVHAIAKYYRVTNQLPPLAEILTTAKFQATQKKFSRLDVYDIAASWMRFLLETHGAVKLKAYYAGREPRKVFGAGIDELEADWLGALDRYSLRPEVRDLLMTREGKEPPGGITLALGDSITLVAKPRGSDDSAETSPTVDFRWSHNGVELPTVTTAAFFLNHATERDGGAYVAYELDRAGGLRNATEFTIVVIDLSLPAPL